MSKLDRAAQRVPNFNWARDQQERVSSSDPTLPGGAPFHELGEPWHDEPEQPTLPPAPPRRAMSHAEARQVWLSVLCIGMVVAVLFLVVMLTIFTVLWEPSSLSVARTPLEVPLVVKVSSIPPAPAPEPNAAPAVTSSAGVPTPSTSAAEAPRPLLHAAMKAPAPPAVKPRPPARGERRELVDPWGARR